MLVKLNKISSFVKESNPFWDYRIDEYTHPDGSNGTYYYVDSVGSTMVIPRLNQSKFIMVRQYRYLNQMLSLEFPGGGIKPGLNPIENAQNELNEETGYRSEKMSIIGSFNPFNGVTNEICNIVLADELTEINSQPDISEQFEILTMKDEEINEKIKQGEIWDGMTLATWAIFRNSVQSI
jgi:ADP-ribose pyrophosphatase